MGAVRDNNFFVVHGWMINRLGLKGNELQVYAIIYGFSQAEGTEFAGSMQYLADWTNATRRTALNSLQSLVEKGLLIKEDVYNNGVKACKYRCFLDACAGEKTSPGVVKNLHQGGEKTSPGVVKNLHQGGEKTSPGVVKNLHQGGEKTSPNNIPHNIPDNIPDKKESGGQAPTAPKRAARFTPPTVEEVRAYCLEKGKNVDAEEFVSFYASKGWMVGANKMTNWHQAVATWHSRNKKRAVGGGFQRPQPERSRIKTEDEYDAAMRASGFGWG